MLHLNTLRRDSLCRRAISSFYVNVLVILCLALCNVIYKIRFTDEGIVSADNLWNPTWLLFGSFLYYAYHALVGHRLTIIQVYKHLIPFLCYLTFYILTIFKTDFTSPWENSLYMYYQNSFLVIPLSLVAYAIYVFSKRGKVDTLRPSGELLVSICGFYIMISILYVAMYLCWGVFQIDMGLDYRIFTYSFLLIMSLFIIRFMSIGTMGVEQTIKQKENNGMEPDQSYANSSLNGNQAEGFIHQIYQHFEKEDTYLNSELSLEVLSKDLDIPKYYFSQLFNVYIGKNFYQFVAEYRIKYAINRLKEEGGRLKIESLAYDCGFNSKTSFNRYFKEITGFTPLEYLQQHEFTSPTR